MEDVFDVSGLVVQWAVLVAGAFLHTPVSRNALTATSSEAVHPSFSSERLQACIDELQWRAEVMRQVEESEMPLAERVEHLRQQATGFTDSLFAQGISGISLWFLVMGAVRQALLDWLSSKAYGCGLRRREDQQSEQDGEEYATVEQAVNKSVSDTSFVFLD